MQKGTWRNKTGYYTILKNGLAKFSYSNTMDAYIYVRASEIK